MNRVFKALAHPVRRKIIGMLRARPMLSGEIAQAFDMAWPSVTAHLSTLKNANLVEAEREGAQIRYRLNISAAEEALAFLLALSGAAADEPATAQEAPPHETQPA